VLLLQQIGSVHFSPKIKTETQLPLPCDNSRFVLSKAHPPLAALWASIFNSFEMVMAVVGMEEVEKAIEVDMEMRVTAMGWWDGHGGGGYGGEGIRSYGYG